ncbi:nucleotidyltransferase domain-containing protein [Ferdinandcohnia quinoae]|uniref:Nucleotidyltransferase domain-containing protein n=1 Tax=Fredinandcohnia quinoae TaxID=2918902 RepID=A0AAW5EBA7_9BACI|nr:nucleotidyltransferase domain-containing protein [Fredinandcohnia sp. SECRCQ15]MCH1627157.1 nucleotidyltransferase domain-containing protein [Fredinandcohnia sp. SECRCQ15]
MENAESLTPIEAARQFIHTFFPNCQGALLAGSVVRGEETATSDLDIIIFDQTVKTAYRESLIKFGWPIEVFVHHLSSYQTFFENDVKRARPSLPRMVSEGIIIKDTGIIEQIKKEANQILEKGPEEWPLELINTKRYFITDILDDFKGSQNRAEELFIANSLADLSSEFYLRTNQQWIGSSKWVIRSLSQFDKQFADEFVDAFDSFYTSGDKDKVILLVDKVLAPYGGTLFHGFSLGKG